MDLKEKQKTYLFLISFPQTEQGICGSPWYDLCMSYEVLTLNCFPQISHLNLKKSVWQCFLCPVNLNGDENVFPQFS